MDRNDFFLDSGFIYGYIDFHDKVYHKSCKHHIQKFPFRDHNYNSVERIVESEVANVARKRKESGDIKSQQIVIRIQNTVNALFRINKSINDIDYIDSRKKEYSDLFDKINELLLKNRIPGDLDPKDNDAVLLTNAFLWDNENKALQSPSFLTTDNKDIKRNEEALISEATNCLRDAPHLNIFLMPKQAS